jgi:hypothetical protein
MGNDSSVILEVIELSVGHFHHTLADNVVVGPIAKPKRLACR